MLTLSVKRSQRVQHIPSYTLALLELLVEVCVYILKAVAVLRTQRYA
jgi:hypothetical protein